MTDDRDLDDELAFHLRQAIEERIARGESRERAEAGARREFGNVTHIKEVTREQRGGLWLERLMQDIRYGTRALRRTPAFTVAAVLTLALAIGANSAVFTVVNGVLLRPLPFRDPGQLFLVSFLPRDLPFEIPPGLLDRQWLAYREHQRSFDHVTAYRRAAYTLSGAGDAARLTGAHVDASFFSVLGETPLLGRPFTADEESGGNNVAVLGNRLWRERFGADPRIIGAGVTLDGVPYTVTGVMPPGFAFPANAEVWTPLNVRLSARNSFFLPVLGRLRSDASAEQARAELATIMAAVPADPRDRPDANPPVAAILPLKDVVTGDVATSLFVFAGAVGFVLLIACVNVANLLLIRAASRQREMAVRVALGAGRGRIVRQLLTESALLALAGGALGVVLAQIGVRALLAIAPAGRIPRLNDVHLDWRVVAFTIAISLATGIMFGVVPALQSARRDPREALAHGARAIGGRQSRLRGLLVSAEVALALVLLTGAGLMMRSFVRLKGADKGYDASNVMTMAADLPTAKYPDAVRQKAFHARLLDALARIPGARAVGAVSWRPMGTVGMMGDFAVDGPTPFPKGFSVDKALVSPGYFAAMGIRLERGRTFGETDAAGAPGVVIVSESVARRLWPGQDAVGKRVSMRTSDPPPGQQRTWLTVVGVVADVAQDRSMVKHSTMYFPYQQSDWSFVLGHMTYAVRSDGGGSVVPAMRAAVGDVDRDVPVQQLMSMDDALMEMAAEPVFQTRLLSVFAVMALLLAAIGTYGVLAYDVTERSREIALRMALGATPGDVILMVMRRTGILAVTGVVVGIAGSLAVTGVLARWLYDVTPTDPATLVMVVGAILGIALLAGFAPARRASRVHVLTALPQD